MKKGFTLIELLGVMVVLGIIALIITPSVAGIIKDSEEKTYNKQVDMIENAAKEWGIENIDFLPDAESGKTKVIDLNKLVSSGKIQNATILDPRTKEEMSGCVVVDYNSEYNQYEYNYSEDENYCIELSKICRPVTEATVGNVPQGEFSYGDEYICDPGDGVERTFFVLEDGDSTELTKGDFTNEHYVDDKLGTTDQKEISLIMDGNIDDTTVAWSVNNSTSLGPVTALAYLKSQTTDKGWSVNVSLPTTDQIKAANGGKILGLPVWLYGNHDSSTSKLGGYWTSTSNFANRHLGFVDLVSFFWQGVGTDSPYENQYYGVRPVITISKNQIG